MDNANEKEPFQRSLHDESLCSKLKKRQPTTDACENLAHHLLFSLPMSIKKFIKSMPSESGELKNIQLLLLLIHFPDETLTFYCQKLSLPKSNVSVLVESLVQQAYIERRNDPKDRRTNCLYVTKKGEAFLADSFQQYKKTIQNRLSVLPPNEVALFDQQIESLVAILTKLNEMK